MVEGPPALAETAEGQRTVVERRVIGHSVRDRPIRAYRVGEPGAKVRAVAIAAMHGDEAAPRRILTALRTGSPVRGVDLWLVPSANPDGLAARTRKNARGVDLNRNFPRSWVPLDGVVESGRGPASEPETRALMRFLERVDPRFVVSFHQPLYGVDTYNPKHPWFAHRLARELRLPKKDFSCGGQCHGTLTQWFNHRFDGVAVTVEYGRRPSALRMTERAPRQLLRALRGDR
ncbi:MAG TPA: M14 family zinc carboxypeptidase [Nocardioidaceae bacterium]|nr:M14 family zinc carboxypeptidase [Nocardioidaceae bacterium]